MRPKYQALIEELHDARNVLASEDLVFARTYVPEQTTRAALRVGIDALAKAINTLAMLQAESLK